MRWGLKTKMLEGVLESFIGTFLAGLALLLPISYFVKQKIDNYNPMAAVFGEN